MVKGQKIKEPIVIEKPQMNYRKLDALNQTMIKVFDNDPVKFFKQFKMGQKDEEKRSVSLAIGDLVDFYLLECGGSEEIFYNKFEEKFALYKGSKGSGQVYILSDYLFDLTIKDMDEEGRVKSDFSIRFSEAVRRVQSDGKYKGKTEEKILEDFEKNGLEYFDSLMNNIGKTVVDQSLVDKALIIGKNIKDDPFTDGMFLSVGGDFDGMKEYYTHFPIEWIYKIDEKRSILCKSEIDILLIDHQSKIIYPRDLKTTYDNESFDYMYIKNGYYLQNAFYHKAVTCWAKDNGMADYKVEPLDFIVGDTSSNNRRPLVYTTSMEDVKRGMDGFTLRGQRYRGIEELIEEISWCEENNIWNCSKDAFMKRGQMRLNIKYE